MSIGKHHYFLFLVATICFTASCSTTKMVPDGHYRLKDNNVVLSNSIDYPEYRISDIVPYIRQKPNTYFIGNWNPFLYVYNWTNQKGKRWDRIVQKVGQAPVILDTALISKSKENMKTHLQFLGYYDSQITDSLSLLDKNAEVTYIISLGKQYPIKEIRYVISDSLLKECFYGDTASSLIREGMPLSESLLETESERSAAYFRNQGYYGFTKNFFFFQADTLIAKDSAILEVRIENYTRNELPSQSEPHRQFRFGKVYVTPVSDMIRYRAALSINTPQILDTLKYNDIFILYDRQLKIKPSLLDRINRIKTGELYREETVSNTYSRFSNIQLYNTVNVQLSQTDSSTVDCSILLLPSKVQGYKLNLEASTNSTGLIGISPAISYYNRNIFRGGEWFNLSLMGNFQFAVNDTPKAIEFGTTASFSFPTFLLLPDRIFKYSIPRTDISISYNYQERPEFTRNMISATGGYSWNSKNKKLYYQLSPAKINIVKMTRMSTSFYESLKDPFIQNTYRDHFDLGAGATVSYLSDPSTNPKVSNFKTSFSLDVSGNLLSAFNSLMPTDSTGSHTIWGSPYSQYVRSELSLVYTWKFGKDNNQAFAARAIGGIGYAYGNATAVPFERLFWVGGSNSMRAWQARALGPGASPRDTTFSIPNQTGDVRLEANIEYRFPMFWLLQGALFFDAGNVWSINSPDLDYNFLKTIAFNTGFGLRVDVDFVVIRVDCGIKLYEPKEKSWHTPDKWVTQGGYAFQFGIGYPF